jgi:hypothetical protein
LKSTLEETLRFERKKNERNKKISAGEKLSEEESEQEKEEWQKERNLDKRKTDLLNKYVFPSMANLVVFFEYAANKELREIFDKDIQALFFGVSKTNAKAKNTDVFFRFIHAALVWSIEKEKEEKRDKNIYKYKERALTDFRFLLFDILQREIWDMMVGVIPYKFNDEGLFHNVIMPDMGRAVAWVSLLSREVRARRTIKFDIDRRPVLF